MPQRGVLRLPLWETGPSRLRGVLPARGNRLAAHGDGLPPRQGLVSAGGDVSAPRGEPAVAGAAGRSPKCPKGPMKCFLPRSHERAMALGQGRIASSSQPACCQVDRSSLVSWKQTTNQFKSQAAVSGLSQHSLTLLHPGPSFPAFDPVNYFNLKPAQVFGPYILYILR